MTFSDKLKKYNFEILYYFNIKRYIISENKKNTTLKLCCFYKYNILNKLLLFYQNLNSSLFCDLTLIIKSTTLEKNRTPDINHYNDVVLY